MFDNDSTDPSTAPQGQSDRSDRPDADGAAGTTDGEPRGADLARSALEAARRAARRRAAEQPRTTGRSGGRGGGAGAGGARRGGYSGAGADPRDPQPFGSLVRRLVADRGWERTAASAGVLSRWEHLVGPGIAAHCRPVSLRDGELLVEAESTAWATQLRGLAPRLVARVNSELGDGLVRRVRVTGPSAPSWRRGPLRVTGNGPRDTYG